LYDIFSIDVEQTKDILSEWFEKHTGLKSYKVLGWSFDEDWKKVVRWETKKRLSN
jgi:molecular chaperone GrpE (heat shock protein)